MRATSQAVRLEHVPEAPRVVLVVRSVVVVECALGVVVVEPILVVVV